MMLAFSAHTKSSCPSYFRDIAEKAQLKAWLLGVMLRRGMPRWEPTSKCTPLHASYACYGAPRKYPIKAVRAVCHQLLKEAGLRRTANDHGLAWQRSRPTCSSARYGFLNNTSS